MAYTDTEVIVMNRLRFIAIRFQPLVSGKSAIEGISGIDIRFGVTQVDMIGKARAETF